MRELDQIDLLVLCAEAVGAVHGFDLIRWDIGLDEHGLPMLERVRERFEHPSFHWWVKKNASEISREFARRQRDKLQ